MRLLPKFIVTSLLIALLPLGWAAVRLLGKMDRSLRSAGERLQLALAGRAADALRGRMETTLDVLTASQRLAASGDVSRPRRFLEAAMNVSPSLTDLWLYDVDGRERAVLHRLSPMEGVSIAAWPSIRRAVAAGGYYVAEPDPNRKGAPRLLWVVPLMTDAEGHVGYLAALSNLNEFNETLRSLDLAPGGRSFLVGADGQLLASSLKDAERNRFQSPEAWRNAGWTTGEYRDFEGKVVLGARGPLPEWGWMVYFEQPSREALALASQAAREIHDTVAGAVFFAVVLAGLAGWWVIRPLRLFVRVVRNMKGGQFNSLIDVRSKDELGDIAQALREAQPELEKRVRDAVLGRMARAIGHDLRTPVEALKNSLASIGEHVTGADETAQRHFEMSLETLQWIGDFAEDMLTIGRDRAPILRPLSLNDLVRTVVARSGKPAGAEVSLECEEDLPLAPMDDKEAKRAIANAVKNALEAVGERGTVTVITRSSPAEVSVIVRDTGPGFPPEKLARLFEEFSTKEHGSGLGLMVIKRVMDKHAGRVTVGSEPGRGTLISLFFPRRSELPGRS